jgi:hypothetical protein
LNNPDDLGHACPGLSVWVVLLFMLFISPLTAADPDGCQPAGLSPEWSALIKELVIQVTTGYLLGVLPIQRNPATDSTRITPFCCYRFNANNLGYPQAFCG